MAISNETKLKIKAELLAGQTPKKLAAKYKVSYGSVLKYKKEIELEKEDETIGKLVETPKETIEIITNEVKEKLPSLKVEIDELQDNIQGLKKLQGKFIQVTDIVLSKAEELLEGPDVSIIEIREVSKIVSNLYSAIYNKNVTNVNLFNNTSGENEAKSIFRAKIGI